MTSPKEPKPKKRLTWRIFEAFVILAGLLLAHQSIWLLFDRYLIRQIQDSFTGQRGSPDLTVYIKPSQYLSSQLKDGQLFQTGQYVPSVDLIGFAPPRRFVVPQVNDLNQTPRYSGRGKFPFWISSLRRGENRITALLEETETESSHEILGAPSQTIVYRPPPLPPRYLAVVLLEHDYAEVRGLAEPLSTVFVKTVPGDQIVKLTTSGIGAFDYRFPIKSGSDVELWAAMTSEGLETQALKIKVSRSQLGDLATDPQLNFPRKVVISFIDDSRYVIDLNMKLPRDSAIYEWVAKKQIGSTELASRVFGLACLPRADCPFTNNPSYPPTFSDEGIQFKLEREIAAPGFQMGFVYGDIPMFDLPGDEVKLVTGDATRVQLAPGWIRESDKTWICPKDSIDGVLLTLPPLESAENQVRPATRKLENLGDFLKELERKVPAGLNRILVALLTAIPYLFLVVWLLRSPLSGYQATLRAVTVTLLLFHLTILSLPVFSSSLEVVRDLLGLFPNEEFHLFGKSIFRPVLDSALGRVGGIYPFLAIGISFLLLPIYISFKRRAPVISRPRSVVWSFLLRPLLWLAVLTVPLGLFGCLVYAGIESTKPFYTPSGQPQPAEPLNWLFFGGAVTLSSLFLWFFLYWLFRISLGRSIRPRSVMRATLAMLILPIVPPLAEALAVAARYKLITKLEIYPFFIPRNLDQLLWLLIIPFLGTLILFQVVRMAARLSFHRPTLLFLRKRSAKWLLRAIFILASLPMGYLLGLSGGSLDIWDLTSLAYRIDELLPYVLLIGLLVYLHKLNPDDSFVLPDQAKRVGVLLFAFYLTGRTANLLFVPIPFLLGWFIFSRWVLSDQSQGVSAHSTSFELRKLVRNILDYRQARSLTHDVRRSSEKKYSAGEIDLPQLKARIKESDKHFADAEKRLNWDLPGSKGTIFGHGPESGPWENARIAVRYGVLLSIPFQASTLTKIFAARTFGEFPLLSILGDVLFSASYWILAAFLFGYFFHLIRGRDGFRKALVYSVALIVPTIPLRIIQAQSLLGQGYVIQVVQIFAFTLVLALVAFDLRSLQKVGYTWRDLLSVHGFTTIMGYVSSIALTTIASISGKDILRGIWNFIGSHTGQ